MGLLYLYLFNVSQRYCFVYGGSVVEKEALFSKHDITIIHRLICRDCQIFYLAIPWTFMYFNLYQVLFTEICMAILEIFKML